jgi:hypothetical protein
VDLYIYSPIHLHGIVVNELSTRTFLHFHLYLVTMKRARLWFSELRHLVVVTNVLDEPATILSYVIYVNGHLCYLSTNLHLVPSLLP